MGGLLDLVGPFVCDLSALIDDVICGFRVWASICCIVFSLGGDALLPLT